MNGERTRMEGYRLPNDEVFHFIAVDAAMGMRVAGVGDGEALVRGEGEGAYRCVSLVTGIQADEMRCPTVRVALRPASIRRKIKSSRVKPHRDDPP